jgi:CelD/BcsL family acetyltransferase involved in cellulose biosynthesis
LITLSTRDDVDQHIEAWEALAATATAGDWMASPQWIIPWMDSYAAPQSWHLVFAYAGDDLVAAFPLVHDRGSSGAAGAIHFPVNTQVRRVGMLSTQPCHQTLAAALPSLLQASANRRVTFERVPLDGEFDQALSSAISQHQLATYAIDEQASAVAGFPNGWNAYLDTRDGKVLRNLRSRRRKIDADDRWRFRTVTAAADLDEYWKGVMEIEAKSWKHVNASSLDREPVASGFYRTVLGEAARTGQLRAYSLEYDEQPVAYAAGVLARGQYYLLKNSYDEAFRAWSPGLALVWFSMEDVATIGALRYDFLGDALPWKRDLATDLPEYVTRTVFSRGNWAGQLHRFIEHGLKPALRGAGITRAIARWRNRGR